MKERERLSFESHFYKAFLEREKKKRIGEGETGGGKKRKKKRKKRDAHRG